MTPSPFFYCKTKMTFQSRIYLFFISESKSHRKDEKLIYKIKQLALGYVH